MGQEPPAEEGEMMDHFDVNGAPPPAVAERLNASGFSVELELLRAFYDSWRAFHKIPRDKLHRNKRELAAQAMVDAANAVAAYRKSYPNA